MMPRLHPATNEIQHKRFAQHIVSPRRGVFIIVLIIVRFVFFCKGKKTKMTFFSGNKKLWETTDYTDYTDYKKNIKKSA
jgi:hypothetical protein